MSQAVLTGSRPHQTGRVEAHFWLEQRVSEASLEPEDIQQGKPWCLKLSTRTGKKKQTNLNYCQSGWCSADRQRWRKITQFDRIPAQRPAWICVFSEQRHPSDSNRLQRCCCCCCCDERWGQNHPHTCKLCLRSMFSFFYRPPKKKNPHPLLVESQAKETNRNW